MNTQQNPATHGAGSRPSPERQPRKSGQADAPPGPEIPHWIRNDGGWQKLPRAVREATLQIITPAYRQFVLDAPNELERTVGLTLVHLTWLELCDQIKLAAAADPGSFEAVLDNPKEMFNRHLRLTMVKCQTAGLLQKLQVVQNALRRPPAPSLPPLSSLLPLPESTGESRLPRNDDVPRRDSSGPHAASPLPPSDPSLHEAIDPFPALSRLAKAAAIAENANPNPR